MIYRIIAAAFLTLCLAVIGLQAPSRAQFNGCSAGFCSNLSASCITPTLDGQNDTNGTGSTSISFVTTGTGVLIVFIVPNGGFVDPTVTGGTGGAWVKRASITVSSETFEFASTGATAGVQSISITNNNGASFIEANGFGLKHASGFDGSAVTGATSVNIVTNFANGIAIAGERTGGTTAFPNGGGWAVVGTSSFIPAQYRAVAAPATVTSTDVTNSGGMIGDALKCGP